MPDLNYKYHNTFYHMPYSLHTGNKASQHRDLIGYNSLSVIYLL